jgi:hypothetical protein
MLFDRAQFDTPFTIRANRTGPRPLTIFSTISHLLLFLMNRDYNRQSVSHKNKDDSGI